MTNGASGPGGLGGNYCYSGHLEHVVIVDVLVKFQNRDAQNRAQVNAHLLRVKYSTVHHWRDHRMRHNRNFKKLPSSRCVQVSDSSSMEFPSGLPNQCRPVAALDIIILDLYKNITQNNNYHPHHGSLQPFDTKGRPAPGGMFLSFPR